MALSISTVGGIVASLLIGRLLKYFNPKVLIIYSAIVICAWQVTLGLSNSIIIIYIVSFLNGTGVVFGGIAMGQILINMWFIKGRGMMMSACMICICATLIIAFPIVGGLIATVGYSNVLMGIGIVACAGMLVAAFISSGAPEKYGLAPLGAEEAAGVGDNAAAMVSIPSLSWAKTIRSPIFWVLFAAVVLVNLVATGFTAHQAVIFGTFGLDATSAAFALSLVSLISLPMQFVFGFLSDRFSPKLGFMIYAAIAAIVLMISYPLVGWFAAAPIALGMALAGVLAGVYGPNTAPRLFGVAAIGDMIGFLSVGSSVGGVIGPILYGMFYDNFGDYRMILIVMGIITVFCLVLNGWVNSKANVAKIQQQIAAEAEEAKGAAEAEALA